MSVAIDAADPVRHVRVELGDLAGAQHDVLVAEDESQATAQYAEPLVALGPTGAGSGSAVLPGKICL